MAIAPWFVVLVLLVVGAVRVAFAVAHAAVYLAIAKELRRHVRERVARAGVWLATAALALPLFGLVWGADAAITIWRETPPGGMRRVVEIPFLVGGLATLELVPALLLTGILVVMLVLAQRSTARRG